MKTSMIYALAFRKHDKILRNYASEKFYESNYYKINSKLGDWSPEYTKHKEG